MLRTTRHGLFWTLTLEMAVAYRRAYIDWCEQSMRLLKQNGFDDAEGTEAGADVTAEAS